MSRELMRLDQLADYLCYDNAKNPVDAVRKWCRRHDVRMMRRGNCWLVRKADADRVLEQHATGATVERARAISGQRVS